MRHLLAQGCLTAFRAARVADALIITHVAISAKLGLTSERLLASGALARGGARLERLALSRHELTRENMGKSLAGSYTARERGGEHQGRQGGGSHFGYITT